MQTPSIRDSLCEKFRSFHVRDSLANSIITSLARSHLQLGDFSTWCDSWLVEWFHHQVKLIPWRMVEGEYSWTIQNRNPPRKQSNIAMEMSNYLIYDFQWSSAIAYIITHGWSINKKSSKITILYPQPSQVIQLQHLERLNSERHFLSQRRWKRKAKRIENLFAKKLLEDGRLWNLFISKNPSK